MTSLNLSPGTISALRSLPQACECCGLPTQHHRRHWRLSEAIRRSWYRSELPPGVTGPVAGSYPWAFFRGVHATRYSRIESGSFEAFAETLKREAQLFAPKNHPQTGKPDKESAPWFSMSRLGALQNSKDENCVSIHGVSFDCDQAGPVDLLSGALQRAGVAHVVTESNSRKATSWHLIVPLATPLSGKRRTEFKRQYSAMVGLLSGLAGFKGVSRPDGAAKGAPNCGLDISTSRLIQPMFVAQRGAGAYAEPSQVWYYQGPNALEWDRALEAIGYDGAVPEALEGLDSGKSFYDQLEQIASGRVLSPVRQVLSGIRPAEGPLDMSARGPLGKAMDAVGAITSKQKGRALRAACPFGHGIDGNYFPGSDTFWCSHDSCKTAMKNGRLVNVPIVVVKAFGPEAERVYLQELSVSTPEAECSAPKLRMWLAAEVESGSHEPVRLARALVGVMLKTLAGSTQKEVGLQLARAQDALAGSLDPGQASEIVLRVRSKHVAGERLTGFGYLRTRVSQERLIDLAVAYCMDTGASLADVLPAFLGKWTLPESINRFLRDLARSLPGGDKVRSVAERPVMCMKMHDEVTRTDTLEVVRSMPLVCESRLCPNCYLRGLMLRFQMARDGYGPSGDSRVEGWEERCEGKPVRARKLLGFKTLAELDRAIATVKKGLGKAERLLAVTKESGAFGLILLSFGDLSSMVVDSAVEGFLARFEQRFCPEEAEKLREEVRKAEEDARKAEEDARAKLAEERAKEGGVELADPEPVEPDPEEPAVEEPAVESLPIPVWTDPPVLTEEDLTPSRALEELLLAQARFYAVAQDMARNQDGDALASFLRWDKGRHRVLANRNSTLHWPSKSRVNAEQKRLRELEGNEENLDQADVDYTLVWTATGTRLHRQDFPHRMGRALDIAKYSGALASDLRKLEVPPEDDEEEILARSPERLLALRL